MDCIPPGSSVHGDCPGKNIGVGCHALLQGIFLTQGLNPGLPHCRWIIYHLSYKESARQNLESLYAPPPQNWINFLGRTKVASVRWAAQNRSFIELALGSFLILFAVHLSIKSASPPISTEPTDWLPFKEQFTKEYSEIQDRENESQQLPVSWRLPTCKRKR